MLILLISKNITYATYYYLAYLVNKCLTSFCLCGPAFGDSDDEDVPIDNALGKNMDDVGGDYPDEPGIFSMIYRRYNIWNYIFYIYIYYLLIILI